MPNDSYNEGEYKWVLGYLSAFEHVNEYPCRDVRKTTLSSLDHASDVLSDAVQAWLFDFMFYELNKFNDGSKRAVWDDPTKYFNLSLAKMRSDRAMFLSKKILEICQPNQMFRVELETGERKWYEHGTNFVFTNENAIWWLRLGEVF